MTKKTTAAVGARVYEKAQACLCVFLASAALLAAPPAAAAEAAAGPDAPAPSHYELGRGLALGNTGFTLGGYATARYDDTRGDDPRLTLDHLSLMVWWDNGGRLKLFSEADLEEGVATSRPRTEDDRFLALERLYLDYTLSDAATIRLGKFLTPIGRWNLIHADPLVWTTSRPLVTRDVFPSNATGAMMLGTVPLAGRDVDYALFVSSGAEWRRKSAEDPFSEAQGLHLNVPLGGALQVGLSFAEFEQESARDDRKRLGGIDFLWRHQGWELTGEAVYRTSSTGADETEKGGFVQLVAPLAGRLYAVGRLEALRFAGADETTRTWVAGLTYRYNRAVSLKAEVVGGNHLPEGAPEGLLASFSVLF